MVDVNRRVLPGFGLSLGYSVLYMSLLVLIPLTACFLKASTLGLDEFLAAVWTERARAAYGLTIGASLAAALINLPFGVLIAWVLVRYQFPGSRLFDAIIDLPFALPTAVAGLVYSGLYVKNGWLGQYLVPLGIQGAYSRLAIVLFLIFIGLPFVVRTVQPVLADLEAEFEDAAASLGANRWQIATRVILPAIFPAVLTGFALAFARGVGEYGSVIFIAGNLIGVTEIAPLLIIEKLEEFDYAGATAIAAIMLAISFVMLLAINRLQAYARTRLGHV
jgi:sulfate/thiosulfate transport system permease protein